MQKTIKLTGGMAAAVLALLVFAALSVTGCEQPGQEDTAAYTVTFNADGGTPAPDQQTVVSRGNVTQPPVMTKTGYTFDGWYKEDTFTAKWDFDIDTVTGTITLFAKWDINRYTVTFNADGGTSAPVQQTVDHGGKVTQPAAMTKTGFGFGGWFKEAELANQWDFATDTVIGDITLYASWDRSFFTVTFNADGGTPAPTQKNIAHDSKVVEPAAMAKTGYTFGGWYKEAALTNQWNFANDTVTAVTTIYAKWTLNQYIVTFNADGGTPTPAQQTVDHGGKVTQPPAMTRTGYTFGGWYKEADFTNVWSFAGDAVTANTTIYAKWTPITYTILYDKNATDAGGTMANSVFTYNVDVNLRTNSYSRSGYRFTGWNTQANGQGTVYTNGQSVINLTATTGATITLYAQWEDLDFAPGEVIHQTFTVVNLNTWNTARSAINSGGNGRTYLINYSAEISVSGSTANTFSPSNIKVVIRGSGEILMTYGTTGRALTVGQNQTVIVRDIRLRGNSDNNSAIVHVAGKLDLKGSANIYSNLNIATNARGSGTYVDSTGTLTMWDDSYIDNNQINTMTTDTNNLFGGGVFVMGTFIMRDNARITNNKITYQWSYWRGSGGGVYVSNTASAIFRMAGGWIEGRGPRNENIAQTGSALYVTSPGVAEYGSFIGETWIKEGNLDTTDNTIRVADGVLQ